MPRRPNFRWRTAALLVLLAAGAVAPAAAQWKWRDTAGRVQYSDRPPPPGIPESAILQRPAAARRGTLPPEPASAPALTAPSAPRTGEPELEARRRRAEQDEAARRKADDERQAAARADNCTRARSQLRALEDGMRIARVNPTTGEREVLDDTARAAETQRARGIIASECAQP